jgi:site-specific DNA-cytosine methylase
MLNVYEFSVVAGMPTKVFQSYGDNVHEFRIDVAFAHDDTQRFMALTPESLIREYGKPDFIWGSPPCITFSIASQGHHWTGGKNAYIPKTQAAKDNQLIVKHLRHIIEATKPTYGFIIENPRGILRKLPLLDGIERRTVTYCAYGDNRMKPTDLWGTVPNWFARPMCKRNAPCHEPAPRGSTGGTLGRKGKHRAEIPYQLGAEIRNAIQNHITTTKEGKANVQSTSEHGFLLQTC